MKSLQPIFLLSLPRSGSTLLQKAIATHSNIVTVSEPWFLLPFVSSLIDGNIYAEYSHHTQVVAFRDYLNRIDGGKDIFYEAIRLAANRLYSAASINEEYFLDKTPRYSLIAPELIDVFPDAKFIFLWRNPIAIVSSISKTWGRGYWYPFRYKVDLYSGFERLHHAQTKAGPRAITVNYETFVENPNMVLSEIFNFIGLDDQSDKIIDIERVNLPGAMGDPTRGKKYKNVSSASLESWKQSMTSTYRVRWCRRYIRWLGKERLASIGYSIDTLIASCVVAVDQKSTFLRDYLYALYGWIRCHVEASIFKKKLSQSSEYRINHD